MREILIMCFGIFIFVLGQNAVELKQALINAMLQRKDNCVQDKEEYETMQYVPDDDIRAVERLHEQTMQTYANIPKTPPMPPQAHSDVSLEDWLPTLHMEEELNVDVEIMTTEREQELYNRAKLGGAR